MKQTIYLPFFGGFYESIHSYDYDYISNDIESLLSYDKDLIKEYYYFTDQDIEDIENKKKQIWEVVEERFDVDYKRYRDDYSQEYLKAFKNDFSEDLAGIGIYYMSYDSLYSPQFYNYGTDEIKVNLEYDFQKIEAYLKENREAFSEYIEEENTARDGFSPFGTNDFDEYISKLQFAPFELTQIIDFYLRTEYDSPENIPAELSISASENIPLLDYIIKIK